MYLKKRLKLFVVVLIFIVTLVPLYETFRNVITRIPIEVPKDVKPPLRVVKNEDLVTLVVRLSQYGNHDNPLHSELIKWPHSVIVSNQRVPLALGNNSVKFVYLNLDLLYPNESRQPLLEVKTPFILMSSRPPKEISSKNLEHIIQTAEKYKDKILIIPFHNQPLQCFSLFLRLKKWTILYKKSNGEICGSVAGNHAIFASTNLLRRVSDPWMEPFPEALFIQTAAIGVKLRVVYDVSLPANRHVDVTERSQELSMRYNMYSKLQVKKVHWGDRVEWYGCTRNTSRCFGTVHNDTPEYLLQGRWTPPCCLRVLRETARHVFKVLETHKVRYWLEGGSLLGAMRSGDIIPWDYDVDVGVYRSDLTKCPWIRELHKKVDRGVKTPSVVDNNGYVWETSRANEGQFYRVQASTTNRLHVDIFPFYPKNGFMTKDTWMAHRQDKKFPESFLKPLTKVPFVGMWVSAPNNIRDFLEFKFGAGCIEHPEYPNPALIAYPRNFLPTALKPSDND